MKIIFYTSKKPAPFGELYKSLDASNNKILISNHNNHLERFNNFQDRILDEAIGDPNEDKAILVPEAVREVFLGWITERYGDDAYHISDELPQINMIGADELNRFVRQLYIVPLEPVISFGNNFFECFWGQLTSFFNGLKQVGALFDPMQGGIFFVLILFALLIVFIQKISTYKTGQIEKRAERELIQGNLEEAEELINQLDENRSVSIALAEIKAAEQFISLRLSPPTIGVVAPPPQLQDLCYIVQSGDTLGELAQKFYGTSDNTFMNKIKETTLKENGNQGIWNTKNNKFEPFNIRIKINWELVIPDPTDNQSALVKCRFNQ